MRLIPDRPAHPAADRVRVGRRGHEHRSRRWRRRLPRGRRAQVRLDHGRAGARAGRDRRLHRPGRGARRRRRARRGRRLPRRLRLARAPVGAGGTRRREAEGGQRPADQLRGRRRPAAGPDHRHQRGPEAGRLRQARADRPDGRPVRRLHRLRHAVGRADDARRPRARARGAGPRGRRGRQGEVRRGPRGAPRVRGQARDPRLRRPRRLRRLRDRRHPQPLPHRPRLRAPRAGRRARRRRASSPSSARSSSGCSTRTLVAMYGPRRTCSPTRSSSGWTPPSRTGWCSSTSRTSSRARSGSPPH